MAYEVSRRSFLKGAAALAVATAASGLLTACGGGKEDNGFTLKGDDYKVYFSDADCTYSTTYKNYNVQLDMQLERITKVINPLASSTDYDKVFSAKIGDKSLTLANKTDSVKKLSKGEKWRCTPKFTTEDKDLFEKATNGTELLYLTITMGKENTTFEVNLKTNTIKYKVR